MSTLSINQKAQDLPNLVLFMFCSFFVLQRWLKLIEEGYKALLEQADEIDTAFAKLKDGYDDFFESELTKFAEERNKNKT